MKKDEAQNTAAFIQDRDLKLTQRSRDANHRGTLPQWNDTQVDSRRAAASVDAVASARPEISTRAASVAPAACDMASSGACASTRRAFFDAYDAAADCLTADDLQHVSPSAGMSVSVCMLVIAIALSFALGLYVGNASK